jgi:hypothetical protein
MLRIIADLSACAQRISTYNSSIGSKICQSGVANLLLHTAHYVARRYNTLNLINLTHKDVLNICIESTSKEAADKIKLNILNLPSHLNV